MYSISGDIFSKMIECARSAGMVVHKSTHDYLLEKAFANILSEVDDNLRLGVSPVIGEYDDFKRNSAIDKHPAWSMNYRKSQLGGKHCTAIVFEGGAGDALGFVDVRDGEPASEFGFFCLTPGGGISRYLLTDRPGNGSMNPEIFQFVADCMDMLEPAGAEC